MRKSGEALVTVSRGGESSATHLAEEWLENFESAVISRDASRVAGLFCSDAYWRDLVALTPDIGWISGDDAIAGELISRAETSHPSQFRISEWASSPHYKTQYERELIEVFVEFETEVANCRGVVRLIPDGDGTSVARAFTLLTAVHELKNHPQPSAGSRPLGLGFDRSDTRHNWLDRLNEQRAFANREPEVLIVGGGHSGVMLAARLATVGVDALIVDRFPRVGDNWRTRYSSLALHNETDVCHFPYIPFPPTFPQYLPKDKLANWIESYVEDLELNFWSSTEFLSAEYDEQLGQWSASVRRSNGEIRVLHPKHVVMATGSVGGTPYLPELRGAKEFQGEITHTKSYHSGQPYAGKNVLVVGLGTSGHDVAFDLYNHGANVMMLQRGPTTVINIESANRQYGHYTSGISTDEADLLGAANFLYPLLVESTRIATTDSAKRDADILERLRAVGMLLDDGEDGTGWLMKFFRRGGGYYINVGASELIADRKIRIIQDHDQQGLNSNGLSLNNGETIPLDAVILATGYLNQQTEVQKYFGDEVANRVGKIAGFDDRGEISNGWRRTAQPGLWFMIGGFAQGRIYSTPLAVQIRTALDRALPETGSATA